MSIRYLKKHAVLDGFVGADDAAPLADWIRTRSKPAVRLAGCEQVHGAVLQVLLALAPRVLGTPADPRLAQAIAHLA